MCKNTLLFVHLPFESVELHLADLDVFNYKPVISLVENRHFYHKYIICNAKMHLLPRESRAAC